MEQIQSARDVLILRDGTSYFVSAVDSCGGIGEKEADVLSCPPSIVGLFTARVPVMELLSVGAVPSFVSVSLCNEPSLAEPILEGIREALGEYADIPVILSTEKNMATRMTALGVTITGTCAAKSLRLGRAEPGDLLCLAGMPLVGAEMLAPNAPYLQIPQLCMLLANPLVGSVIPAGSGGIAREAELLARESGLQCLQATFNDLCTVSLRTSAGPASCAVFTAKPAFMDELPSFATVIGTLVFKENIAK